MKFASIIVKYIYRAYQLLISPLLLLLTILTGLATIIGCSLFSASWWSYYPGKWWSWAMVRLLLLPVRVQGREHLAEGQSFVIIPNHQGAFDIFLIYGFLGRHFKWMMKSELRRMPLVGRACEAAGFIFVEQKGGPKKLRETHDRARRILQGGTSVVVFPEGARTWDGRMRRFKRGAFQLADELQLPLLPVTINGSFNVLPRTRGFGFVTWHPLELIIHPSMRMQGQGSEAEREVMQQAADIIQSRLTTECVSPDAGTYDPDE